MAVAFPSFPPPPQLTNQFCFLSPYEERDRIRIDLNQSVLLIPSDSPPNINTMQLARILCARYGGSSPNWGIQRVRLGYLVKLPDWTSQDQIYMDEQFWFEMRFTINTWWALQDAAPLPTPVDLVIAISDFPTNFRHPYYYRQATSAMGIMMGVVGIDRLQIRLMLRCYARELIPAYLFVGHGELWSKCTISVQVDELGDGGGDEPSPPPTQLEPETLSGNEEEPETLSGDEEEHPSLPYVPPWRRRLLSLHPPQLPPAAYLGVPNLRFRPMDYAPEQIVPEVLTPGPYEKPYTLLSGYRTLQKGGEVTLPISKPDKTCVIHGQTSARCSALGTCHSDPPWKKSGDACQQTIGRAHKNKATAALSKSIKEDKDQISVEYTNKPEYHNRIPRKQSQKLPQYPLPHAIDIKPLIKLNHNSTKTHKQKQSTSLSPLTILHLPTMGELIEEEQSLIQKFIGL